ncbi:hypothetical protein N2152v2_005575 [Parachlorella kessleri]
MQLEAGGLGAALESGTAGFPQVAGLGSYPAAAAGAPNSLFQQQMNPQASAAQLDLWAVQSGIGAAPAPTEQQLPIPTARPLLCQRYKICPEHVQMHSMLRDGVPHRFCQQCGRFQPLTEFDEDRRTCRRKLERHNARRRKKTGTRRTGTAKPRRGAAFPAAVAHSEAGAAAGGAAGEGAAAAPGELVFSDGEGDDVKMGESLVETDAALGDIDGNLLDRVTVATAAPVAGAGGGVSLATSLDPALTALAADLDIDIPSLEELAHLQPHLAPSEAQQEQPSQRLPSHQSAPAHLRSVLQGPRGDASPLWIRAVTPGGGFRSLPLAARFSVPEAGQTFLSASAGASPLGLLPSPLQQQQGQQPWGSSALPAGAGSAAGLVWGPPEGTAHGFGGLPGMAGATESVPGISAGEPPQQGSPWSAVLRQSGGALGSPDAFDAVLASLLTSPATTGPGSRPDASPLQRAPVNGPPPALGSSQQNTLIAAAVAAIAGAVSSPSQQPGREAAPGGVQGSEAPTGTPGAAGTAAWRVPVGARSPGMDVRVAEAVSAPQPPGGFEAGPYAVPGGQQAQQAQQEGQQAAQQAQQQHRQLEYELELIRQEVLSHPDGAPAAWQAQHAQQAQQGQWGGAQHNTAQEQAQQAAGPQLQVAPPPVWIVTPSQQAQQAQQPQQAMNGFQQAQHGAHTHGSAAVPPAAVLDALQLLRNAQQGQQYLAQERMRRLSMKLFNVGPEVLPPETRGDLEGLLGVCPGFVETHLRPGCIHVALSGLVQEGAVAGTAGGVDMPRGGIRQAVESLLSAAGQQLPQDSLLMVQLGEELAVVEGGRVAQVYSLPHCQGVMPAITSVFPICLPASGKGRVVVQGHNLVGRNCQLFCRHRGGYPLLEIHALGHYAPSLAPAGPGSAQPLEWIHAALPGDDKTQGLYILEVQRGALLGAARPLLVVKDPRVVEEVNQLARNPAGIGNLDGFLEGMGMVLAFLESASSAEAAGQSAATGGMSASENVQGAAAVTVFYAEQPGLGSEEEKATGDASSTGLSSSSSSGEGTSNGSGCSGSNDSGSSSTSNSSASAGNNGSSSSSDSHCKQLNGALPAAVLPAAAASCLHSGGCPAGTVRVELSHPTQTTPSAEGDTAADGSGPHGTSTPPAAPAAVRVAGIACRLAVCAVARGWAATTALLLPAVSASGRAAEAVAALKAACPPGTTLLHLAVAARNPQLLEVLGAWGQQVGHSWNVAAPGGVTGITPVHLVAGMRDEPMLRALAALNRSSFQAAWSSALTADGYSPAAFAQLALGPPSMPSAAPTMPQQKALAPRSDQEAAAKVQEAGAAEQAGPPAVQPGIQQALSEEEGKANEQEGEVNSGAEVAAAARQVLPAGAPGSEAGDEDAWGTQAGDPSLSGPGTPTKPPVKAQPYGSPPQPDLGPTGPPAAPDCESSSRAGASSTASAAAGDATSAEESSAWTKEENSTWSQEDCCASTGHRNGSSASSLTSLTNSDDGHAPGFDDSAELPRMAAVRSCPGSSAASSSEGCCSAGSASSSMHVAGEGAESVQDSAYFGAKSAGVGNKPKGAGAGVGAGAAREGTKAGSQAPNESPQEEMRPSPADSEEEELVRALRGGLSVRGHEVVEELLVSQYG